MDMWMVKTCAEAGGWECSAVQSRQAWDSYCYPTGRRPAGLQDCATIAQVGKGGPISRCANVKLIIIKHLGMGDKLLAITFRCVLSSATGEEGVTQGSG